MQIQNNKQKIHEIEGILVNACQTKLDLMTRFDQKQKNNIQTRFLSSIFSISPSFFFLHEYYITLH